MKADKQMSHANEWQRRNTIKRGDKYEKKYVTLAIIGKTGTGKSTIANAFLAGAKIREEDFQELF